nr:hypothetical protein [Tanacetum cinerariifolium]
MKSSHKAKIAELESRVKKLEEKNMSLTKELKSFNTMVESSFIKETVMDKEESSKQGRKIADIDANAEVNLENVYNLDMAHEETVLSMQDVDVQCERIDVDVKEVVEEMVEAKDKGKAKLVEEPKILKSRKAQIAIDEEVARRIEAEWNADINDNIDWIEVVEQVQSRQSDVVRKYQALKRKPVPVAQARKNMTIYLKNMAGFQIDFFKGMRHTEKQKLKEQQEAKEFKKNLEIVPDDEDDVFVNVTPLSSKPPTIVDYKIYKEGKNEHFQIIRANGNPHMYLAFSTLLKNFDREDLEVLWKIVKDRFKESQPKEVLDVFLWHTLKMYPLTNYTLQQMFNEVRLQVDYEVEMAYDLLRLGRIIGYKVFIKLLLLVIIMKKTLSVSAVSIKSYCCQFMLMLLEEEEEITTA